MSLLVNHCHAPVKGWVWRKAWVTRWGSLCEWGIIYVFPEFIDGLMLAITSKFKYIIQMYNFLSTEIRLNWTPRSQANQQMVAVIVTQGWSSAFADRHFPRPTHYGQIISAAVTLQRMILLLTEVHLYESHCRTKKGRLHLEYIS